jgi:hypothetical protein
VGAALPISAVHSASRSSSLAQPLQGKAATGLTLLVLFSGLALTIAASAATGPCFDEERRIAAARHATELARAVGDFGPSAFGSSSAQGIYSELSSFGVIAGLVSGWLGEVLARAHVLDGLTASRFGWLLITGLAPGAVYLIVEVSRGPRVAALAACLLVGMPRWMHAAGAAREPAVVTSLWLLVLAAYVRSLPPPPQERRAGRHSRPTGASLLFALVLALGVATDLATLWVLPLVVLHYFSLLPRRTWAAFRRGRAPLPGAFLWAIVVSPPVLVIASPALWQGGAAIAATWLFAPLAPTVEPVIYGGPVVCFRDVPPVYGPHFLAATVPVAMLLLSLGGAVVLSRDALAARKGGRPRDPRALGRLCLFVALAVLVGPIVTPRVLTLFPPRLELFLPIVAIVGAVGLERLATRVVGNRRASWVALGSGLLAMSAGLAGLPTASAAFNVFSRGTKGAIASRTWTAGDGSEVAALAPAIDALGARRLSVQSSEVPRSYWALLSQIGRLRTRVEGARGAGDLVVTRGRSPGAIATVERGGATLWSLTRP